jgi:hypothetical protein
MEAAVEQFSISTGSNPFPVHFTPRQILRELVGHEVSKENVRISADGCHAFARNFTDKDILLVKNNIKDKKFGSTDFDFTLIQFRVRKINLKC